ncbi:hypothetical protein B9S64_09485 [Streptomyces sp. SM18]|nr:hypothetical protein B9S64_09485 [Streptomyces sp. SM18]
MTLTARPAPGGPRPGGPQAGTGSRPGPGPRPAGAGGRHGVRAARDEARGVSLRSASLGSASLRSPASAAAWGRAASPWRP